MRRPPTQPTNCFLLAAAVACGLAAPGAAPRSAAHPRRYPHIRATLALANIVPAPAKKPPTKKPIAKPRIPTAAALYQRSLKADDLYSYRGRQITTYWRPGRAVAVIVSHRAPALRRIDYLAPDTQRGRSVVTDTRQQWQYEPRQGRLLHRRLAANAEEVADAAEGYDLLRTNYVLQVVPHPRTWADRKVFLVTVTRKSPRTAARKLWIDAATGLVLKRENYREDGKLALTVAYSDITFRAPLPRTLFDLAPLARRPGIRLIEERATGETPLRRDMVAGQLGGTAVAPSTLSGYRLVSAALTQGGKMLHLRYSDGLNLISLFEQRRTQTRRPTRVPPSMRPARVGRRDGFVSHHASLTALNWDAGPLNLTLMGEIAEPSLQALAAAADH